MARAVQHAIAVFCLVGMPILAEAQQASEGPWSEERLRAYFEGRTVAVRIDMPATQRGVDVHPDRDPPLDVPEYAERVKDHGAALRAGQSAMITRIEVKGDHIEFHLAGGGFGTWGDPGFSSVSVPVSEKSLRERELEDVLKTETDRRRRRLLEEELEALRSEREWEDAQLRILAADVNLRRRAQLRELALQAGSRFNLRYGDDVPATALTPEGIMTALAAYVDFSPGWATGECTPVTTGNGGALAPLALRKGLSDDEVERLFGTPESVAQRKEGNLDVVRRTYVRNEARIEADFVDGVLVRYVISSP